MAQAIGMVETRGFIGAVEAADAMIKAADVQLLLRENVDAALVTIIVEGDVGAVQAALDVGQEAAARVGELIAAHLIPRPDDSIKSMLKKNNKPQAVQRTGKKKNTQSKKNRNRASSRPT